MRYSIIIGIMIIIVVANATSSDERKQLIMKLREACAAKSGIPVEQGVALYHGDFTINDEKSQCFIACLLEKSGYLNANGEPNPDEVITQLLVAKHVTNVETVLNTCRGERGANACESAFNFFKCYHQTRVVAAKSK